MKICFCTVVKNRLHHIQQTLERNIQFNNDYKQLQFVVLDYNSSDGLGEWIMANMQHHIATGRLVYYRTPEPTFFHRSHSRNLAMKLADGDIICNIDADNFTGPSFARYISECFARNENVFMCTHAPGITVQADVLGRVCVKKSDFLQVGGYDETMESYGFEDYDLINRLGLLGLEKELIDNPVFLHVITHSDYDRIAEEKITKLFGSLYVRYISAAKSEILILLNNGTYQFGRLIDCKAFYASNPMFAFDDDKCEYEYILDGESWMEGNWLSKDCTLELSDGSGTVRYLTHKNGRLVKPGKTFYHIDNSSLVTDILMFHSQLKNRNKMKLNMKVSNTAMPDGSFGSGKVFKNFELYNEIVV